MKYRVRIVTDKGTGYVTALYYDGQYKIIELYKYGICNWLFNTEE